MKYRVRLDFCFENEGVARGLYNHAVGLSDQVVSINEGEPNEEISFCDLEICRHDEGLPCEKLERVEIRK